MYQATRGPLLQLRSYDEYFNFLAESGNEQVREADGPFVANEQQRNKGNAQLLRNAMVPIGNRELAVPLNATTEDAQAAMEGPVARGAWIKSADLRVLPW